MPDDRTNKCSSPHFSSHCSRSQAINVGSQRQRHTWSLFFGLSQTFTRHTITRIDGGKKVSRLRDELFSWKYCVMSTVLRHSARKYKKTVIQKCLEKGHTQMEVDSCHSKIECVLGTIKRNRAYVMASGWCWFFNRWTTHAFCCYFRGYSSVPKGSCPKGEHEGT